MIDELEKIKEIADGLLFAIKHDSDFPMEQDEREIENLINYANNVKLILNESHPNL